MEVKLHETFELTWGIVISRSISEEKMRKSLCVAVLAVSFLAPWVRAENVVVQTARIKPKEIERIAMPEPSSVSILAVDLLAVGGLVLLFRRRRTA